MDRLTAEALAAELQQYVGGLVRLQDEGDRLSDYGQRFIATSFKTELFDEFASTWVIRVDTKEGVDFYFGDGTWTMDIYGIGRFPRD